MGRTSTTSDSIKLRCRRGHGAASCTVWTNEKMTIRNKVMILNTIEGMKLANYLSIRLPNLKPLQLPGGELTETLFLTMKKLQYQSNGKLGSSRLGSKDIPGAMAGFTGGSSSESRSQPSLLPPVLLFMPMETPGSRPPVPRRPDESLSTSLG